MSKPGPGALLCVANYSANAGYAWDFIEGLYAKVADRLAPSGIMTFVSYPGIRAAPAPLAGSAARAVVLDGSLATFGSLWRVRAFIRTHRIRVMFFTDRPSFSFRYWWLRLTGVRHIVVYDHTSGAGTPPRGIKFALKWILARLPGLGADYVLTVSDYVAGRQRRVNLTPQRRIKRIWNAIPLPPEPDGNKGVRTSLGLADDRPLVLCCCRAAREKGVDCLLQAFERVMAKLPSDARRPLLVYVGDGPHRPALEAVRGSLASRADILFVGYRSNAREYIRAADICVMPSLWQEAFGLGVLEPMAFGKPVIASRVGGIPELVRDGVDGVLVPPGEVEPLADALLSLLRDPDWATQLGRQGRARVADCFRADSQITALAEIVQHGFRNKHDVFPSTPQASNAS
jgi:glycosyltransferase involved in cell wall biosynthesis